MQEVSVLDLPRTSGDLRTFAVASYNIHRAIGLDRKYHPERIAAVLRELDADIIGLQEIDAQIAREDQILIDYFAESLGMHAVAGPNVRNRRLDFGNAILSRFPILEARRHSLAVRNYEPRGAVEVVLDVGGLPLRVIVAHLGLRIVERRTQIARLLDDVLGGVPDRPTIVMGDFNEWRGTSRAIRRLDAALGPAAMLRSFPSRRPFLPLDRIWVYPDDWVAEVSVHATPVARVASDHLPVRATVRAGL